MNTQTYKKTRYQNIYKHYKNGNYIVMISKPVKTSISRINGDKIWKIEDALDIRNNRKLRLQKGAEIQYKNNFDSLWDKYINWCIYEDKQDYNTYNKKQKLYNSHLKNKFTKQLSKITKEDFIRLIDDIDTTDKQKNEIIKLLKAFLNWCVDVEKCLVLNPIARLKKYKVDKPNMKYWLPEHLNTILNTLNNTIESKDTTLFEKYDAWIVKIIILIGFSLGDRIGETRALQFKKISKEFNTIKISNSINYDPNSTVSIKTPKTKESNNELFVSTKLITEINNYKKFLKEKMCYTITEDTLILFNFNTGKPFTDTILRKKFNYFIELSGVPKIRMYDLRHTLATTMMSEGYDMYAIQDRLRHKSIKTTIDNYGHITLNKRKEMAQITDKYI